MDYKELNLIGSTSPHIRTRFGTGHIMGEVIIAMLPALCFAIYNFGFRALMTTLVSVAGCCAFEWIYRAIMGKSNTLGDMSAAVTGIGQINRSHMIAGLTRDTDRPLIILCQDDMSARRIQEELKSFLDLTAPILPGRELTFYDAAVVSRSWEQKRLRQMYDSPTMPSSSL